MRGVKKIIYDNVQIKVITIYSGAVWLKQLLLYFILYMPPILDFGLTTQCNKHTFSLQLQLKRDNSSQIINLKKTLKVLEKNNTFPSHASL
jgi:hypothetical protein